MILTIIIIYYLGRQFYRLAEKYDKKRMPYAILGVVIYYLTMLTMAFILGMIYFIITGDAELENSSSIETILGILSIPFGLLGAYLLHRYLDKKWKKEHQGEEVFIEDIGKH